MLALGLWLVEGMCFGARSLPDHLLRVWQTEDGLPDNKVMAVAQTGDGYLWAATYSGLARFDGVRFTVFDNSNPREMHSPQVTSLFQADDGALWIGHADGEVTCYQNGRFRAVPLKADWNGGRILGIGSDREGDIWFLNEEGLLARERDGLVLTPLTGAETNLVAMARSPSGTIWIARDGQISELEHGRLNPIEFAGDSAPLNLQGIGSGQNGDLWALTDLRMHKKIGKTWTPQINAAPWGMSAVHCLLQTREGYFAAGTSDQGLFLVSGSGECVRFCRTNGLPVDWVTSLCEDREGNLWAGTGGGLVQLRRSNLQVLAPPDRWQGRAVLAVQTTADGAVWVGTEGAGLYRCQDGRWDVFGTQDGLANLYIWSITEDYEGCLWAGTWGGGLFLLHGHHFDRAPGLETFLAPIPALLPARGGLWVGTGAGLMRYNAGNISWLGRSEPNPLRGIRALAEDGRGTVWIGMSGGGLACLKDGRTRTFKKADGLSSDFVQCLHLETNGVLWVGTFGGGITRVKDERLAAIGLAEGLPNMVICNIQEDAQGFFWLSSHAGILRVSKAELNDCADGQGQTIHCLSYGRNDGLPTLQCSGGFQPAGCKTADGRLWFPTTKGLVVLDPRNVFQNPLPPSVVIEQFLVDGQAMPVSPADVLPLRIPAGRNRFEFRYTGLSFIASEKVQFKYRLVGLDKDWLEADTRRLASYSYIPPGDYSFQVIACNNDGAWNDTGATLAFTLLPLFWQTLWFRSLATAGLTAGLAGLVWFDTRRRMRRKLERLERQRALEHERARIAKDIHDDLGASLTRITLLSQPSRGDLSDAGHAAVNLDRIYSTARELTRAMDEIVWAVNPQHDTLDSLAIYLGKFGQDFLRAAQIRCRLLMPVELPAWPLTSEQRHNLFLAYKEALHNVVKHSHASEVSVSLNVQKEGFVLTVEDNGCGFSPNASDPVAKPSPDRVASGNGLANMCRRLEEIHGRCEITSESGQGITVKFTVRLNCPGRLHSWAES